MIEIKADANGPLATLLQHHGIQTTILRSKCFSIRIRLLSAMKRDSIIIDMLFTVNQVSMNKRKTI
jgi:hypothetical protein